MSSAETMEYIHSCLGVCTELLGSFIPVGMCGCFL